MNLPENLSLPLLADVMTALGVPMDRGNVGRALQAVVIAGVEAPKGPGDRWRLPRRKLTDVVAACLYRRRHRSHDRSACTADGCLLDAAALMMRHDELHAHVPKSLQRQVLERREARRRAEEERRRRIQDAERRRLREQREAWRRKQEEERAERERWARRREEEEHERVVAECYRLCFRQGYKAIGSPQGPRWPELPEAVQLRRGFPHDRPAWWEPPPGMHEAVKEYMAARARWYLAEESDWSRWVPPYVPGQPWPWRRSEAEADAGVG
jgi:hypothetical protein